MAYGKKRFKMSKRSSRRQFARHADRTNRKNMPAPRKTPMRGGIRL